MRNLFLALVLANLGFAAWHSWYADDDRPTPMPDREFGEIMLAAEFADANPEIDVAPARVESDASAVRAGAPVSGDRSAVRDASNGAARATQPTFRADPQIQAEADRSEPGPAGLVAGPSAGEQAAGGQAAGDSGGTCMSVGPFSELSQVASAAANLREDGLVPRQRTGEGDVWAGYWVYLERIESIAAARTMLDTLHEGGLGDAYIIPSSDSGTLISLGIFSEIIRASRVRERARELGFDATIADRLRRATVYWIDVELEQGGTLDFDRLQPPGRIVRLELRPCEDVEL